MHPKASVGPGSWSLLSEKDFADEVVSARDAILRTRIHQPAVGIILGSGLGALVDDIQHPSSVAYPEIPGFPQTAAVGHAGKLVLGFLGGLPVVVMQGRAHRYEGWPSQAVEFPVHCMSALGAQTLIVTNAAGGLNPRYRAGDLMAIDGHIDMLWYRQMVHAQKRRTRNDGVYDRDALEHCKRFARRDDTVLHQGTYLGTLGPTYETRNEYRAFRELGGDAVGMSTLPEVKAASECGMSVVGFSVITNVASTDVPQSTTHEEVVDCGNAAGPKLMRIITNLLHMWAGEPD
ncbi:MAG: purine nucleoside phosphorylase I, inosine and guanosine-specific [Aureliella sp.]